jgi:hypothetical protein
VAAGATRRITSQAADFYVLATWENSASDCCDVAGNSPARRATDSHPTARSATATFHRRNA